MAEVNRVREIFDAAIERSGQEREAFLDAACAGDSTMRAKVADLIWAAEKDDAFLSEPTADPGASGPGDYAPTGGGTVASAIREKPGTRIGPYKLLQLIGEGGFGSVFMAEQEQPVRRTVALKIIKLGMDTHQVVARFEQERQALAMMDHPNIARVLDAGATETGRPYFVMELVKGDPIVEYCDNLNLRIEERLELFAQVCTAVQHAHTKGIIHRDLKPSNILVSMMDGRPSAKVIDFGIAKATNSRLTEKTLFTEHRQLIGTPEYMSPEQAEGSLDIDTRTDVYSLGVLLYELLTGSTPFDSTSLRSAAYGEIQRIIREVDPPKPSTRLSEYAGTIATVAARRHTEPRKLGIIVRGELDWIVMKALEKDRQRRYETANGLAMDVRRYLAGEAVVAAPPSQLYRMRKFVRRNRGAVTAAAIVAIALMLGILGTVWQANVARGQRDLALQAQKAEAEQRKAAEEERNIAQNQRNVATQEAARAKAMSSFVEQLLLAADPDQRDGGRDVTVLQLLSKASAKADKTLKDQPMVEASARTFLGNTLCSIGQVDEGIAELNRAIKLREGTAEAKTFPQAESYRALGQALTERQDRKAALAAFEQAQAIAVLFKDDRAREVVTGYVDLAKTYLSLSRFAESEMALDQAEELYKLAGLAKPSTLAYIVSIRGSLANEWHGDNAKAEELAEQEVSLLRQADGPVDLAGALNNLALMKMRHRKFEEAHSLFQEAIELTRREFGENNQRTAMYLENHAQLYFQQDDHARSLAMLEEVVKVREAIFGADSLPVARTRLNKASIALATGQHKLALELTDAALPVFRKSLGDRNLDFAQVLRNRGAALKGLGDLPGALAEYQSALTIIDAVAQPNAAARMRVLLSMTEIHCALGHPEDAQRTTDLALKVLDPNKPDQAKRIKDFQAQMEKCKTAASP